MHPPARLLHDMANAETKKKKKKKDKNLEKSSLEPKHSKAARRFFNQNFKEPGQRISKVLAASGGNLPFYQLLIFIVITNIEFFSTRDELNFFFPVIFRISGV